MEDPTPPAFVLVWVPDPYQSVTSKTRGSYDSLRQHLLLTVVSVSLQPVFWSDYWMCVYLVLVHSRLVRSNSAPFGPAHAFPPTDLRRGCQRMVLQIALAQLGVVKGEAGVSLLTILAFGYLDVVGNRMSNVGIPPRNATVLVLEM
jgi:hypothetical protein